MSSFLKKYFLLLLPLIISCTSSGRFVQLTNENGKSKSIYLPDKTCFYIGLDSVRTDSSQYQLFTLKKDSEETIQLVSYWRIGTVDTIRQGIEFRNCAYDSLRVFLNKEQIKFLSPVHSAFLFSVRQSADIVILPAFILGTIGTAWGLISLPFPSTPWREDFKLLRGGVIALGIFGLAVLITDSAKADSSGDKYRLKSVH